MAAVKREGQIGVQTFGEHNHGGVGAAEREVAIGSHQLGDPVPIIGLWSFDRELRQTREKLRLDRRAKARRDEVRRFGNNQYRAMPG